MPFEVFDKRKNARSKALTVTIQRRGIFSISASAHEALGGPKTVELLYDPDEKIVGLRGVPDDTSHGYTVRHQPGKNAGAAIVAGQAFTQYYGIDTEDSRRRDATVVDGILCVDLKEPGSIIIGARSRGREQTPETFSPSALGSEPV